MRWSGMPYQLWGPSYPNQNIVGESNYVSSIRSLCKAHDGEDGQEVTAPIFLLPEPNNPYDANAVVAVGGGRRVGYLPREDAARYAQALSQLVAAGFLPVTTGRVYYRRYDFDGMLDEVGSVQVALDEPHRLVPTNRPPNEPHGLLPRGNAIQVSGEAENMDVLVPRLHPAGDSWLYVTLHRMTAEGPRARKDFVEVRVDGTRVGQLSPKMSSELLPAIDHLTRRGLGTAARALLKGNSIKAEVVIHAARAHELPEEWLANPTYDRPSDAIAVAVPDSEGPAVRSDRSPKTAAASTRPSRATTRAACQRQVNLDPLSASEN